jgi:hypothetical protein
MKLISKLSVGAVPATDVICVTLEDDIAKHSHLIWHCRPMDNTNFTFNNTEIMDDYRTETTVRTHACRHNTIVWKHFTVSASSGH